MISHSDDDPVAMVGLDDCGERCHDDWYPYTTQVSSYVGKDKARARHPWARTLHGVPCGIRTTRMRMKGC